MNPSCDIKKSPFDTRLYKGFLLPNEIQCIIISDPSFIPISKIIGIFKTISFLDTDKSAASLLISIGSAEDPHDVPGLAHFHEHMLFLGTKKYPTQNEFTSYLSKNSSDENNAETSLGTTEFFFDCGNEGFYEALDMFSQFFISPLFTPSCTEKEIQAVNSEYEMILSDDNWRNIQLFRSLSNPKSLLNRFAPGNKETLKVEKLNERLLEFNRTFYSSNLMKLSVYSNESLETIEKWVFELFSPITNLSISKRNMNLHPPAFEIDKNMKKFVEIVPIKDLDVLEFIWVINEDLHKYYRTKPDTVLGHLFGHEGPNSLLSLLKEEGLATALIQSTDIDLDNSASFLVRIELTKKGFEKYQDVCELVFYYLKKLKEKTIDDWKVIFEEFSKIEEISFLFKDKMREITYVSKLVNNMRIYPAENALNGEHIMDIFDFELLMKILNIFTSDNLIIFFLSKNFQNKTSCHESFFNVHYNIFEIPEELMLRLRNPRSEIAQSKKMLDLPPKNPFIPKNFEILPKESIWPEPKRIYESEQSILWFKQGTDFNLPKIVIELKIFTDNECFTDLKNLVCADLWLEILQYQINEVYYMAGMAKLYSMFTLESNGLCLVVQGFSDSCRKYLLEALKNAFCITNESKGKFPLYYEKRLLEYTNYFLKQPFKIVRDLGFSLLIKNGKYHDPKLMLETMKKITIADFEAFEKSWLSKIFCEWFINGNILEAEAFSIVKECEKLIQSQPNKSIKSLSKAEINSVLICKLAPSKKYLYEMKISNFSEKEEKNSAIKIFWQGERATLQEKINFMMIDKILMEPCFDKLRTEQQIGYVVSSKDEILRGVCGFGITLMSCTYSCQEMARRIHEFIKEMKKEIEDMEDDEFEEIVESLIMEITAKFNNISEESDFLWDEIYSRDFLFNRKEIEKKMLEKIKKEEILSAFEKIFEGDEKILEIHVVSNHLLEENEKIKAERIEKEGEFMKILEILKWTEEADCHPDYYHLK